MLKKRVITALCGIPILVAAIWFERPLPWFTVLTVIWGILAILEFYRLVSASKVSPLRFFGLTWTLLFLLSGSKDLKGMLEPYFNPDLLTPILLFSAILLPLFWLLLNKQRGSIITKWSWTVVGILYTGWLLSYLIMLRDLELGRNWLFLALFTTFASDTTAFFVGRAIGKHRLAPNISPAKTWEGAIAGIIGAAIISLLFTMNTALRLPLSWWQAVIMGFSVSIFGQAGDLLESLFKRRMGVKDSGNLLPGHGGILDRMDSIIFAGVVVYVFTLFITP